MKISRFFLRQKGGREKYIKDISGYNSRILKYLCRIGGQKARISDCFLNVRQRYKVCGKTRKLHPPESQALGEMRKSGIFREKIFSISSFGLY